MFIIVFEPHRQQYSKEIIGSLDSMKSIVGGEIEVVNLKNSYVLICNKDGISLRLRQNNHRENMVGIFFIAKMLNSSIMGLEKKEIKRFTSKKFAFNKNLL